MFKRREPLPIWKAVGRFLWPHGGWGRAALYVKHRLRRLPDSPRKISRGITWRASSPPSRPFYGAHFVVAAALAVIMRGNLMAALLGTFFGNPLTYVPIGVVSLNLGHWMLGTVPAATMRREHLRQVLGRGAEPVLEHLVRRNEPPRGLDRDLRVLATTCSFLGSSAASFRVSSPASPPTRSRCR